MSAAGESAPVLPADLSRLLRSITERMAQDLGAGPATAPSFSPTEWRLARAVAVMHGVSALLLERVRWPGPDSWTAFLEAQRAHTRARHLRAVALLEEIDRRSRLAGVAFIALKGAALHALGLYSPGQRPMADLDLLVRERDRQAMAIVLGALGYREPLVSEHEDCYLAAEGDRPRAFGENEHHGITIEVHFRIAEPMPVALLDITQRLTPLGMHPGCNGYRSDGALLAHLLMHAAVNMKLRSLRLVQLHDLALLAAEAEPRDWSEATSEDGEPAAAWWALPPLRLLERYYHGTVPAALLARLARGSTPRLRRLSERCLLSDVSGSNLHLPAFPGLGWSRSVPEMLQFIAARAGRAARIASGGIAVTPEPRVAPWAPPSHRRRLWDALARRARADTLYTVNAALHCEP